MAKPAPPRSYGWQDRFFAKVSFDPDTGCWVWVGARAGTGYSSFFFDGKVRPAHRVAYQQFVGPIPEGLHIDHLCRNPACVNPAHLEPVTCKENMHRGESPNIRIHKSGTCARGHGPEEQYYRADRGTRQCNACRRYLRAQRKAAA